MWGFRAAFVLILAVVPAGVLAPLSLGSAATRRPPRRCDVHGPGATAKTRRVLVYLDDEGVYWACLRPSGSRAMLAPARALHVFPGDADVGHIRVAGTDVAAESDDGPYVSDCFRDATMPNPNCPKTSYYISVVELKSRRHTDISSHGDPVVAVALSADDRLAWVQQSPSAKRLEATVLRPRGRSGLSASPKAIDSGNINLASVRISGRTLFWTKDGRRHRTSLR